MMRGEQNRIEFASPTMCVRKCGAGVGNDIEPTSMGLQCDMLIVIFVVDKAC